MHTSPMPITPTVSPAYFSYFIAALILVMGGWTPLATAWGFANFSPWNLLTSVLLGIFFGAILYSLSSLLLSPRMWIETMRNTAISLRRVRLPKKILLYMVVMVVGEELVWRVYAQNQFLHTADTLQNWLPSWLCITLGIGVTAAFFTMAHHSLMRREYARKAIELFIFSIMLGVLWFYSKDFLFVCLVHYARNFFTLHLQHNLTL